MARRKEPRIPDALLDQLLAGADPKTAFDPNGLLDDLKKALAKTALNAEMDHHLATGEAPNSRNGYGKKTVVTDNRQDRARGAARSAGEFRSAADRQVPAPVSRFDEKIISMYARGMTTREIAVHQRDLYGIDASPDLISAVTDAVIDEVAAWQAPRSSRPIPLSSLTLYA